MNLSNLEIGWTYAASLGVGGFGAAGAGTGVSGGHCTTGGA